jgi:hypothetical protein
VAWGDFDNDGLLDFLLTGGVPGEGVDYIPISQLWRNTGTGFTNVTALLAPDLPGVAGSAVAWGDFDNDGRLDFLLMGTGFSQLWRNTGNGFTDVTAPVAPGLLGVRFASVAWGDYDNDGRLDFILAGEDASDMPVTQLWRNTEDDGFANVTLGVAPGLNGAYEGSMAWGDYDNDGRLDLLFTGAVMGPDSNSIPVSQLWRNTGNGFTDVTASVAPGLPGVYHSSVAWGDYDNDGRLDFLLAGRDSGSNAVCQLWRNTGNGFTNVTASVAPGLPGVDSGSVSWGDYDHDGRLDFLLTAASGSQLWRNKGSGFTNVTASVAPGLPGAGLSSAAWGDFDNDGRLDFLLTGSTNGSYSGAVSQLWRNNTTQTISPPAVITGLPAIAGQSSVTLNAQVNPHGRAAIAWFVWGNSTNYGQMTAAQPMGSGNSFTNFYHTLTGLSTGVTYYYRAVGSNDQGQVVLGVEQHFVLAAAVVTTSPVGDLGLTSVTLNSHANPNNFSIYGWFEWGPTPAYGQVTPVQSLGSGFDIMLSQGLSELEMGHSYYFRAVFSNSLGVVYGAAQSLVLACPGYIQPITRTHGHGAASSFVSVELECDWIAINTNSWITITSPANGTGSGGFTYTVPVNTDPQPRSGNIVIGGHVLSMTQLGGHPYVVTEPTDQTAFVGGTASFNVVAIGTPPFDYQWEFNLVPLVDGNGISGATTSNLVLTGVQLSQVGKYRVVVGGEISASGKLIVLCSYSLTASNASFDSLSATNSVSLTTQATDCPWSVVNTNPWIAILSGITNAGNGTVVYSVAANPNPAARSGSILIADRTYTITQSGGASGDGIIFLPEALDTEGILTWKTIGIPAWFGQSLVSHDGVDAAQSAPIGDSTAITMQSIITGPGTLSWWWKVSSETNKDLLKFFINGVQQTRISGEVDWQSLSYTFPSGTYTSKWTYSKNATVTGGQDRGWLDQVQFVPGTGCAILVSPTNRTHGCIGATNTVAVTAQNGCAWSVATTNSWISILSTSTNSGNGTVIYSIAPNTDSQTRSGHIAIGGKSFLLTQSGVARLQFISLAENVATLSVQGDEGKMFVVECSEDLIHWTPISTNSAPSTITTPPVGNAPRRFYRTVEIP